MRLVAHTLLDPLYHLILVLVIAFLLNRSNRGYGQLLIYYSAFWFFLTFISPVPYWLTAKRESQYAVFDQTQWALNAKDRLQILVLGAGHAESPALPPNDQLSHDALGRLVEGLRLQRQFPGSKLICSGYSSSGRTPQAEVMARTALALGTVPGDTLMLPLPGNTEEEALYYTRRFGTERPLILVTSAIHMPRAMYWFREMGADPIAAPTNHLVKPDPDDPPFWFKPSLGKVKMTKRLLHEYAGMIHAFLKKDTKHR